MNSCKKQENLPDSKNENKSAPSNFEIMTNTKWVLSDALVSGKSIWNSGIIEKCNKDDIYRFSPNNDSLIVDEGPTKCSPSYPQVNYYSWKLIDNDKKIVYLDDTFTVLKIESKRLEFSMISSGVEATSVYTPY